MEIQAKQDLLKTYTTVASVIDELCAYTANKFTDLPVGFENDRLIFHDEKHISVWKEYLVESKDIGVFETLKKYLVQLQFPIRKNISQSSEYRNVTLKGMTTHGQIAAKGLQLKEPDSLDLIIHQSFIGKIPVLVVTNNDDFVSLFQALTHSNEPVSIPDSMGAAMISGLNNWDRIFRLRKKWIAENPFGNWNTEFQQNVSPNKSMYQDKLILLSKKPYSGISSKLLGLSHEEWIEHSMKIRLEHECAHFFTLRVFDRMANNMHDELIADYMGITKVLGKFKSDWFLRFIGLEDYPEYREGGRLQNYVNPIISKEAVVILRTIIKKAAVTLELFDENLGEWCDVSERIGRLLSICSMDLLQLSAENGHKRLLDYHNNLYHAI